MTSKTATGTARIEAIVSIDNLFKATFRRIFDLVNDNLTDPKAAERDKWIWTTLPEAKVETRADYPRIILTMTNLTGMPLITFDQKTANPYIYVQIYSTSKSEADTLSDTFISALHSSENALESDNLESLNVSADVGDYIRSKFPVYYRSFRLGFSVEGI